MAAAYALETDTLRAEIQAARDILAEVKLTDAVAQRGLAIIHEIQIDSLRAEITFFEAARAHAAADGRVEVQDGDLHATALLALRARGSTFMREFFSSQQSEETEIRAAVERVLA
jgi:Mg-chelatase subunit ChlI